MPAQIVNARWLDDGGLEITYRYDSGALGYRLEPAAGGRVTLREAATILKLAPLVLYRLRARGKLRTVTVKRIAFVRVRELARLRVLAALK